MLDLIIKNGTVIDGTGAPGFASDIGVNDGRIAAIGKLTDADAAQVFDAAGLTVCPGFIDAHHHGDITRHIDPSCMLLTGQGVTTYIAGLCGISLAPYSDRHRDVMLQGGFATANDPEMQALCRGITTYGDLLRHFEAQESAVNGAFFVGLGNIRGAAMGYDASPAGAAQIAQMQQLIAEAMDSGCLGLSAGFIYTPDIFAGDEELLALLRTVGEKGGIFNVHMRNEAAFVIENMEHYISLCKQAGCRLHISHLKTMGIANHGKSAAMLEVIEQAKKEGFPVSVDAYPFTASASTLKNIIPPRFFDGGLDNALSVLSTPGGRAQVRAELQVKTDVFQSVFLDPGPANIVPVRTNLSVASGISIQAYADKIGIDPLEAAFDILLADGGLTMAIFYSMSWGDVDTLVQYPDVCFGSDGAILLPEGAGHPRYTSTFVTAIERYVQEKKLLSLEEAVRKMTSLPASIFGLKDRGVLRQDAIADITVLNQDTLRANASYEAPFAPNDGISLVICGGQIVAREGKPSLARPGNVLKRGDR